MFLNYCYLVAQSHSQTTRNVFTVKIRKIIYYFVLNSISTPPILVYSPKPLLPFLPSPGSDSESKTMMIDRNGIFSLLPAYSAYCLLPTYSLPLEQFSVGINLEGLLQRCFRSRDIRHACLLPIRRIFKLSGLLWKLIISYLYISTRLNACHVAKLSNPKISFRNVRTL